RSWKPPEGGVVDTSTFLYGYKRLKIVRRNEEAGATLFRMHLHPTSPDSQIRFPPQLLEPHLRMSPDASTGDGKRCHFEVSADFRSVPVGEPVDLYIEFLAPGLFLREGKGSTTLVFDIQVETAEVIRWLLL